ncbi:M48 family metalloprotease [Magnetofaba australis]|nr:M48 family metalloprotease [Magnetofaba australis]
MTVWRRALDARKIEAESWRNRMRSAGLILALAAPVWGLGWLLGGESGAWLALLTTVWGAALLPAIPGPVVMSVQRGRRLSPAQAPGLHATVRHLSQRAGLDSVPQIYWLPQTAPNAMLAGPPHAQALGVTEGLLRLLSERELSAVLAHEIGHAQRHDAQWMGLAHLFEGATTVLALLGWGVLALSLPLIAMGVVEPRWGVLALLAVAPWGARLLVMALSRSREFEADLRAAALTGDARGLASALVKLEAWRARVARWSPVALTDPGAPWLRSHPDAQERVSRLLALERASEFSLTRPLEMHCGEALRRHGRWWSQPQRLRPWWA